VLTRFSAENRVHPLANAFFGWKSRFWAENHVSRAKITFLRRKSRWSLTITIYLWKNADALL
jgi:hypothetical protein